MTKHKLFKLNPKLVRDTLNKAVEVADSIHKQELELVRLLGEIDQNRFFIRYGYKSLMGFCNHGLNFTETQSQRIVTRVRRSDPIPKIGKDGENAKNCEQVR